MAWIELSRRRRNSELAELLGVFAAANSNAKDIKAAIKKLEDEGQ